MLGHFGLHPVMVRVHTSKKKTSRRIDNNNINIENSDKQDYDFLVCIDTMNNPRESACLLGIS